jgi:dihydrofolate reductase
MGKPIVAIDGAGFMRSLIATGLIDEYHFVTHPVVLGQGLTVFIAMARPLDLKLADVNRFPGRIVTTLIMQRNAFCYYAFKHQLRKLPRRSPIDG